ncbi:hypothetical protein C8R44DRAFT_727223 [Mycena epipterygia]|nr:hypothetical protein C8R44DRAFT_727223 [Mycena epipterygia]
MSLLSVPVELVYKILCGATISDLLGGSRWAKYSKRLTWCWSEKVRGLYGLPEWQPWKGDGSFPHYRWPYHIHVLTRGHSFLIDALHPAMFSIHGTYAHQFDIDGSCKSLAWSTQDNGMTIDVAIVYGRRHTMDNFLKIYRLQFDSTSDCRNSPTVLLVHFSEVLDLLQPISSSMQNSVVLVWGRACKEWPRDTQSHILLIDMTDKTCVRLVPPVEDHFQIAHASLHPQLPLVALVLTHKDRGDTLDQVGERKELSDYPRQLSHSLYEELCVSSHIVNSRHTMVRIDSNSYPHVKMVEYKCADTRWLSRFVQLNSGSILDIDLVLANKPHKGKHPALAPQLVITTWSGTLDNEQNLPADWIREPRVLVAAEALGDAIVPHYPTGVRKAFLWVVETTPIGTNVSHFTNQAG